MVTLSAPERLPPRRRIILSGVVSAAVVGAIPSRLLEAAAGNSRSPRRGSVALVLGGGGCRGYGHIGFIQGLDAHGFKPDLVVGSSVGSLIGALYASGKDGGALEKIGARVGSNTLRNWIFPNLGVFGGDKVAQFVKRYASVGDIERLPVRFAAVATDLQSGQRVVFDRGDLGRAVQASSSLPGLIEPVRVGSRYYVDGNLSSPVPVTVARELGAQFVVAVDVTFPPEQADLKDPFDALYQAFSILTRRLAFQDRAKADLVIEPKLPIHDDMSPATIAALIASGREAASKSIEALRRLFAKDANA